MTWKSILKFRDSPLDKLKEQLEGIGFTVQMFLSHAGLRPRLTIYANEKMGVKEKMGAAGTEIFDISETEEWNKFFIYKKI